MKKDIIVRFVLLVFMLTVLLLVQCQFRTTLPSEVTEIVEELKAKHQPDLRISIFDVEARRNKNEIVLTGETLSPAAKSELMHRLSGLTAYSFVDSVLLLPAPVVGKDSCGIVRLSVGQIRRGPNVDYEIVTQTLLGERLRLLKRKGWWYYVQLEDQYLGWIMRSSLAIGDATFLKSWDDREKLVVTANWGQVLEKPDADYWLPVADLVLGNRLAKIKKTAGWYQVELPDGREGFVAANLVAEADWLAKQTAPTEQALVKLSYRFKGIPYFWGGRSTKGFDCSGFTQTVFGWHGIQLPRDANMQLHQGVEVEIDEELTNLKTGDLLFFGRSLERITHVGMFIGNDKFIHADGIVHINSFNPQDETYSEHRKRGLKAVRRILK
ncbi:MAG: C40 family peptidase [bacterium]|nr:C40 family peptidase [bacterium]